MLKKKKTLQVEDEEPMDVNNETKEDAGARLRETLENINTRAGIVGYILRGPTSASVDLKDTSKIIDYAVLSSSTLETSESLSSLFKLGKTCSVVLESKDMKVLCMTVNDHRLSVFMEKTVNHDPIYKKLA
ncbi:MAG: hypothetical protein JSV87_01490 [Candidatus Bathyarchaeota archaeon]|jgi:predicted regulator of Ras-like GTPase activity (Roadblock/LC7/MglB family)|nr:hypothetical protein [Candidatus Bathyarchaeota archaeon]UCD40245.1 MAG: hypothetical protein JSV87_01490 [Candidatus Bathyarchaeota archaeon]